MGRLIVQQTHAFGFMIIRSTRTRQGTTCSRCSFAPLAFAADVLMKRVGVTSVQRLTIASKTRRISRSRLTNRTWTGSISRCFASLDTASAHAMSCARRSATGVDAMRRNVVGPRRLRVSQAAPQRAHDPRRGACHQPTGQDRQKGHTVPNSGAMKTKEAGTAVAFEDGVRGRAV